jgi:hypothetical protein
MSFEEGMEGGFTRGFIIGVLSIMGLVILFPDPVFKDVDEKIAQCEASLLRNQVCELVAVPKIEK